MRRVAVITAVAFVATMAATLLVHSWHASAVALSQLHAQQAELTRRLDRIDQTLSVALKRNAAIPGVEPQGPARIAANDAAISSHSSAAGVESELRAAREERMRAANEIVDRTVAAGVGGFADFAAVEAATRGLPDEERANIMARLSVAVNAGQLRFDRSRRLP